MLQIRDLSVRFGGLTAVNSVSLEIESGELFGIIGPNGAGKTTLFNALAGTVAPSAGEIRFRGGNIERLRPYIIAQLGIARTFQIVRPFSDLTVLQNVLAGFSARHCRTFWRSLGQYRRADHIAAARALLERTELSSDEGQLARNLPLGLLRRLEIARALALDPDVLLLDESFSGLSHREAGSLAALVRSLSVSGMTIVLIEHNMQIMMNLCTRLAVLDRGVLIAQGPPAAVREDENVIRAYLEGPDD